MDKSDKKWADEKAEQQRDTPKQKAGWAIRDELPRSKYKAIEQALGLGYLQEADQFADTQEATDLVAIEQVGRTRIQVRVQQEKFAVFSDLFTIHTCRICMTTCSDMLHRSKSEWIKLKTGNVELFFHAFGDIDKEGFVSYNIINLPLFWKFVNDSAALGYRRTLWRVKDIVSRDGTPFVVCRTKADDTDPELGIVAGQLMPYVIKSWRLIET